jgi:hypothetical protein
MEEWPPAFRCYDFSEADTPGSDAAAKRTAYLRYVRWMVERFAPHYINVAVEINLFAKDCHNAKAWQALAALERDAYDMAKSIRPGAVVFPSIQIDHLYDEHLDGFNLAKYQQLAGLKRDRFAISTYPYFLRKPGDQPVSPADLPGDYFTRAADYGGEQVLIAETGWNSHPIFVRHPPPLDQCAPLDHAFSEAQQAQYLDLVLRAAQAHQMELVTWWSDRDLIPPEVMSTCYPVAPFPFAECGQDHWCQVVNFFRIAGGTHPPILVDILFKVFGRMGLRDYDGTPKPLIWERWQQARRLSFSRFDFR